LGGSARKIFQFSFNSATAGSGSIASERRNVNDFEGVDVGGIFQVEITIKDDFGVPTQAVRAGLFIPEMKKVEKSSSGASSIKEN